jgi:RimJ/RimL family protein N-acetyltransferase
VPPTHVYLETERLILRRLTPEDADDLAELNSDPEVMRYLGGVKPREQTLDEVLPRLLADYERSDDVGFWAAIEKATGEWLGWFHLRPEHEPPHEMEVGYRLKRSAWGKGYGTEGTRALIAKSFDELGVERVVAVADEPNVASRRVMEKSGMHLTRRFLGRDPDGSTWNAVRYAIDRPRP